MTYSDLYKKRGVKIPSILAVVIVAAISFLASGLILEQPKNTQATKKNVISLSTTNIGSNKAVVVWRTSEKEVGSVLYGTSKDKLSAIALDQRDTNSQRGQFFNHSVPLQNLAPKTKYYYSITNGKALFEFENRSIFTFSTISPESRINNLKPAYGTVVSDSGQPESNVLVTISAGSMLPLSTLSKESGEWLIPLNSLIDKKSLSLRTPATDEVLAISLYDEKGNITNLKAPIHLLSPVADPVRMGSDYTLPEDTSVLSVATGSSQITITPATQATQPAFQLQYPLPNIELPVGNPLIKGKAPAQSTVSVTITGGIQNVTKTAIADQKGEWKTSLASQLPAGSYTLVAQVIQPVLSARQTRTFTVAKSGQQVLGEATNSAQLTSAPTPTTQNGRGGVQNTPTPTSKTTPTPTDFDQEPTEITPTLPATGGTITYLVYSSAALILLGLGLLALF